MAKRAIVDIRKLQGYCLNLQHPRGRHKARVFASVGIRAADAEELRSALLVAAKTEETQPGAPSPHGQRYMVAFDLSFGDETVRIRSAWIVRLGEDLPRLTSCYVL
jgi:hypothetical protein